MAKGKYERRKAAELVRTTPEHLFKERQKRAQARMSRANARGVYAIRRRLHRSSYPIFSDLEERLLEMLGPKDHLYNPKTIGVTVVGFSRFSLRQQRHGPTTAEILETIPRVKRPVEARLGELGLFGSGENRKLGFRLVSAPLEDEIEMIEEAYRASGFTLKPDRNNGSREDYLPHVSFASLLAPLNDSFGSSRALRRLDDQIGLLGTVIKLGASPDASARAHHPVGLAVVQ